MSTEALPQRRTFLNPEQLNARIEQRINFRETKIRDLSAQITHLDDSLQERQLTLADASRTLARTFFAPKTEQSLGRRARQLVRSRKLSELGNTFPLMSDEVRKAWEVVLHHREAVKAEKRQKKRAERQKEKKKKEISAFEKWQYFLSHRTQRDSLIAYLGQIDFAQKRNTLPFSVIEEARTETTFKLRDIESRMSGEVVGRPERMTLKGKLIEELLEFAVPRPKEIEKNRGALGKIAAGGLVTVAMATAVFIGFPTTHQKIEVTGAASVSSEVPDISVPTYTPVSIPAAEPTDTPRPTGTPTPEVINTPSPTATKKPTQTPSPTATFTASPTATRKPAETATATPTAAATNTPKPKSILSSFMKELNDYRSSQEVALLEQDNILCDLAQSRLEDIKPLVDNELQGHPGFNARAYEFFNRFVHIRRLGENLARGVINPFNAWHDSPDHNKNMLNIEFNAGCFSTDGKNSVLILGKIIEDGTE